MLSTVARDEGGRDDKSVRTSIFLLILIGKNELLRVKAADILRGHNVLLMHLCGIKTIFFSKL